MRYEQEELLLSVSLSLSFQGVPILREVAFEIFNTVRAEGKEVCPQVVAVLGPSGVGKTQLFRCIAGLQVPTQGAVFVNDDDHPVEEGEVGVVAQDYPLIETRTVLGNLMRAYQVSRRPKACKSDGLRGLLASALKSIVHSLKCAVVEDKVAKETAFQYLEKFGLTHLASHYPSQLSGGQRQRIAIIQQMICSKHFLLMDEPFSGLDVIAKNKAMELITEMASADELNTVIITTHDIRSACAVADRVILLGRERDGENKIIPGARVLADIDLKANDLCWIPGITTTPKFLEFVAEIERDFVKL
jgi:polar amino acid transport system ATP-binding protein/sulfate transport system ATP-binding protein